MAKVCAAMLDKKKSNGIGSGDKKKRREADGGRIVQGYYTIKIDRNASSGSKLQIWSQPEGLNPTRYLLS